MHELGSVELNRVKNLEDAQAFMRWLGERRDILAIDTETTGLEWWTPHFTRLVQFGDSNAGWTISIRDWRWLAANALKCYEGPVTFHNAKFDMHALENEGLQAPPWHQVHDTLVLHHIVNPARPHGLKPASEKRWGWAATAGEKLLKQGFSKHGWDWATVPEDFEPYGLYAALDTVLTARLYGELAHEVKNRGMWDAYEREMAASRIMFRAEKRGLRVDPVYTLALRDAWTEERIHLKGELASLGICNPNSNKQVTDALKWGGWDPEEFTETGLPKLDKQVLREIMAELGVNAEIATKVQRHRRLTKWTSAYLDAFLGKRSDDTWHTHPSVNTLAARTGRMSITGPPLQTLPKGPDIRHCILPEENENLYTIDYDAQELRLFAHFSGEPGLIEAIASGKDMHRYTASVVYGRPYDDISKDDPHRQIAKNTRYSQIYGAGPAKIAQTAGVPLEEIEHFIRTSDIVFPGIPAFMDHIDILGRTRLSQSGVAHVWTHGGRYMPSDPDKVYALVNYLIQGTAADLLKNKLIQLDQSGFGDWIMCPVHDEVIFSVPKDGEDQMPEVKAIMEDHTSFNVPLVCELSGPFSTWGYHYV